MTRPRAMAATYATGSGRTRIEIDGEGNLQGMDYPKRGEGRWIFLALVVLCVAVTLFAAGVA